jgi:hypothetical protein
MTGTSRSRQYPATEEASMIANVVGWTLALAALAADPAPCTSVQPGAWAPMATAGAPELGEIADPQTRLLGGARWWLWNADEPLTASAVFDARCNAWRPTKGPRVEMSRQYGLLTGADDSVVVYGPTHTDEFAAYALDPKDLRWGELPPPLPAFQSAPQVVHDDRRLLIWDPGRKDAALLAGGRWEAFALQPPALAGHGYDCSFFLGDAWFVAGPSGVTRFDLAKKSWATAFQPAVPLKTPDLGACTVSFSGGLAVVTVKPLYGKDRLAYGVEGASAFEIPWPEGGPDQALVAAGGTAWSTQLRRYDRAAKKWTSPKVPKGAAYVYDARGQARFGPPDPAPDAFGPRLDQPPPPKWLAYRDLSPALSVTWGVVESRVGNNCHNPFHPQVHDPRLPICTPSVERTYSTIHPGGFFFLRGQ